MPLPVTITFAALYMLALIPLTGWIGLTRQKIGALRGDGGDPILFKRIRFHGNLTENGPAVALALGGAESLGLDAAWLWATVVLFILGRALYFWLYDREIRALPMVLTQFPAGGLALWCLYTLYFNAA
ncbi:MAG: MAPEG family protein [Pseudorhodobacter sp.]